MMKNHQLFLLVFISTIFSTNGAVAQNQPLACQGEESAGLIWENGRWVTSSFFTKKFILVKIDDKLTNDSAAKALDTVGNVYCQTNSSFAISCMDTSGGNLYFSTRTLKGARSQLIGSASNGARRDSVYIEVFSCTKF